MTKFPPWKIEYYLSCFHFPHFILITMISRIQEMILFPLNLLKMDNHIIILCSLMSSPSCYLILSRSYLLITFSASNYFYIPSVIDKISSSFYYNFWSSSFYWSLQVITKPSLIKNYFYRSSNFKFREPS